MTTIASDGTVAGMYLAAARSLAGVRLASVAAAFPCADRPFEAVRRESGARR